MLVVVLVVSVTGTAWVVTVIIAVVVGGVAVTVTGLAVIVEVEVDVMITGATVVEVIVQLDRRTTIKVNNINILIIRLRLIFHNIFFKEFLPLKFITFPAQLPKRNCIFP